MAMIAIGRHGSRRMACGRDVRSWQCKDVGMESRSAGRDEVCEGIVHAKIDQINP